MSHAKPVPLESARSARSLGISLYRCQMLAYNLNDAFVAISKGRPGEVPGEHLDDYLRLNWLRWELGRLRLTLAGATICTVAA